MNLNQVSNLLTDLYETGITVELVGPPGIGKTEIMESVAQRLSAKYEEPFGLLVKHVSTMESIDVAGFMVPSRDPKTGVPIAQFTRSPLIPHDDAPARGAVFLDERGQASVDVQKPLARFMLERKIGDSALKPGWVVWSARNRTSDKSGVVRDLRFLTNRMIQVNVDADPECWYLWAEKHDVSPLTIAYARFSPHRVFLKEVPEGDGPFTTPRTLVMADKAIRAISDEGIKLEAVCGLLGEGTAIEYMKFLRVESELPTKEEIIRDPHRARIPSEERPDAQYAAVHMAAHHADDKCIDQMFHYLFRFAKEFQLIGVQIIGRKNRNLLSNPLFTKWSSESKGMLMEALRG
jgi:hypothetical protein